MMRVIRSAWLTIIPWWARLPLSFGRHSTVTIRDLATTPRDYVDAWRFAVWAAALCAIAGLLGAPHPAWWWRRRRATAMTRLIAALMASSRVRVRDVVYHVDTTRSELYTFQEVYGLGVYDRVPRFLPRPGWLVVDVGANIGVFAAQAATRGARVHAFEPNPGTYARLLRTVCANKLHVTARPVAVGAQRGWATLTSYEASTPLGTIVTGGWAALTSHEASTPLDTVVTAGAGLPVPVVTLDEELADVPHIDLLKIDTEGSEADVLRGASQVLRRTDRIVAKYHSETLLDAIWSLLTPHGFKEVATFDDGGVGIIYAERDILLYHT